MAGTSPVQDSEELQGGDDIGPPVSCAIPHAPVVGGHHHRHGRRDLLDQLQEEVVGFHALSRISHLDTLASPEISRCAGPFVGTG